MRKPPDDEHYVGEQERRQQRALGMAMSIATDLQRMVNKKRSQILLTRSEELTALLREFSNGLQ